jgi:hypothetical protein
VQAIFGGEPLKRPALGNINRGLANPVSNPSIGLIYITEARVPPHFSSPLSHFSHLSHLSLLLLPRSSSVGGGMHGAGLAPLTVAPSTTSSSILGTLRPPPLQIWWWEAMPQQCYSPPPPALDTARSTLLHSRSCDGRPRPGSGEHTPGGGRSGLELRWWQAHQGGQRLLI